MMNLFDLYPNGENEGFDRANDDPADRTDRTRDIKKAGEDLDVTAIQIK